VTKPGGVGIPSSQESLFAQSLSNPLKATIFKVLLFPKARSKRFLFITRKTIIIKSKSIPSSVHIYTATLLSIVDAIDGIAVGSYVGIIVLSSVGFSVGH